MLLEGHENLIKLVETGFSDDIYPRDEFGLWGEG